MSKRTGKPHGLKGRKLQHKTIYTPEDNEAAKKLMLAVSYEDIKREFLEAVAESHEKTRRMQ